MRLTVILLLLLLLFYDIYIQKYVQLPAEPDPEPSRVMPMSE